MFKFVQSLNYLPYATCDFCRGWIVVHRRLDRETKDKYYLRIHISDGKHVRTMAYLYCRRRTRIRTKTPIQNSMATLYYTEHVHIAQTQTWIPSPYFCTGQESESECMHVLLVCAL